MFDIRSPVTSLGSQVLAWIVASVSGTTSPRADDLQPAVLDALVQDAARVPADRPRHQAAHVGPVRPDRHVAGDRAGLVEDRSGGDDVVDVRARRGPVVVDEDVARLDARLADHRHRVPHGLAEVGEEDGEVVLRLAQKPEVGGDDAHRVVLVLVHERVVRRPRDVEVELVDDGLDRVAEDLELERVGLRMRGLARRASLLSRPPDRTLHRRPSDRDPEAGSYMHPRSARGGAVAANRGTPRVGLWHNPTRWRSQSPPRARPSRRSASCSAPPCSSAARARRPRSAPGTRRRSRSRPRGW